MMSFTFDHASDGIPTVSLHEVLSYTQTAIGMSLPDL